MNQTSTPLLPPTTTGAAIFHEFERAGLRVDPDPDMARLIVRTLRLLSEGESVAIDQLQDLARDLEDATSQIAAIQKMSERDAEGRIAGLMGLSLNDHPHQFDVGEQRLHAWCAWDTLFLPPLLGQTAHVTSIEPSTGDSIRLTITPEGVTSSVPPNLLISVVIPSFESGSVIPAHQMQEMFCSYVHFFTSIERAEQWFSNRDLQARVISVEEGFKLGQLRFSSLLSVT